MLETLTDMLRGWPTARWLELAKMINRQVIIPVMTAIRDFRAATEADAFCRPRTSKATTRPTAARPRQARKRNGAYSTLQFRTGWYRDWRHGELKLPAARGARPRPRPPQDRAKRITAQKAAIGNDARRRGRRRRRRADGTAAKSAEPTSLSQEKGISRTGCARIVTSSWSVRDAEGKLHALQTIPPSGIPSCSARAAPRPATTSPSAIRDHAGHLPAEGYATAARIHDDRMPYRHVQRP